MDEHLLRFDSNKKLCFLDMETENLCLYMPRNLPWQVAMLNVVGDTLIAEYVRYIKWWRPPNVSEEAARITRFDPRMVEENGTDYKEVVKDVVEWTSLTDYIIGHNVLGFDIYFLIAFYRLMDKSPLGLAEKIIDTHALAKGMKLMDVYDKKKGALAEYQYRMIHTIAKGVKTSTKVLGPELGIEHDYERLHDALIDLQLNFKIWKQLKHKVEV